MFLYIRTIRYLKLIQILYQLKVRISQKILPKYHFVTAIAINQNIPNGTWTPSIKTHQSWLGENSFIFLNITANINNQADWNSQNHSRLWLYNLHYLAFLNQDIIDDSESIRIIMRWIKENPPGIGCGWEPYPLSLRIVNLLKWVITRNIKKQIIQSEIVESIYIQAHLLSKQIEYHLLGNHLFVNAKALFFAGIFFTGKMADSWLNKGVALLEKQINEQILPDGGHFELSPMYHALILEDILDIINIANYYASRCSRISALMPKLHYLAKKMLSWLNIMSHPDGEVSFFNDSVMNVAPSFVGLVSYAKLLGIEFEESIARVTHLRDSGYICYSDSNYKLLFDCANVIASYIPGHTHADTLSFELSLFGNRAIVNTGISTYDVCDLRLYQRSTKAHNTVTLADHNSSEVWGGFRLANRASTFATFIDNEKTNKTIISSCHDGYKKLKGKPIIQRTITLEENQIVLLDEIHSVINHDAVSRLYLHPQITLINYGENSCDLQIDTEDHKQFRIEVSIGKLMIDDASWYPQFNIAKPNKLISITAIANKCEYKIVWK